MPADGTVIVGVGGTLRYRIDGECSDFGCRRGTSSTANKARQGRGRRRQFDSRGVRVGQIDVLECDRAVRLDVTRRSRDVFLDRAGDDRRSAHHDRRRVVGARNRDRNFDETGVRPRCRGDLNLEGDGLAVIQEVELLAVKGDDAVVWLMLISGFRNASLR